MGYSTDKNPALLRALEDHLQEAKDQKKVFVSIALEQFEWLVNQAKKVDDAQVDGLV